LDGRSGPISRLGHAASLSSVQANVRDFFRACGIDFPKLDAGEPSIDPATGFARQTTPSPSNAKAIFFNDRTGVLFVRATMADMEIIEQAIAALNFSPPQVTIEAVFIESPDSDVKALGFDWLSEGEGDAEGRRPVTGFLSPAQAKLVRKRLGGNIVTAPRV